MASDKSSRGLLTYAMKGRDSVTLFCCDVRNPIVKIRVAQMSWLTGSPEPGEL